MQTTQNKKIYRCLQCHKIIEMGIFKQEYYWNNLEQIDEINYYCSLECFSKVQLENVDR